MMSTLIPTGCMGYTKRKSPTNLDTDFSFLLQIIFTCHTHAAILARLTSSSSAFSPISVSTMDTQLPLLARIIFRESSTLHLVVPTTEHEVVSTTRLDVQLPHPARTIFASYPGATLLIELNTLRTFAICHHASRARLLTLARRSSASA